MRLLLTNDDGIEAAGLEALERAVAVLGEFTTVAPTTGFSGCGHQVTAHRPLSVRDVAEQRYTVDGTPADCVRVGLVHLAPNSDWVLSGINHGGNLGVDVYMSGTAAAAREAALFGKRAMALSQYRRGKAAINWAAIHPHVHAVFEQVRHRPLKPGAFWNVNFPDREDSGMPEIVFCHLEPGHVPVRYEIQDGQHHYQGNYHQRPRQPGSDVDVCFSGNIAVTQVSFA
jgi:5'-nucleotidase